MPDAEQEQVVRQERLRLDYQQTTDLLRTLTDIRFKLLALVPTLSGAAVAVLGKPHSAAELLAVGLIGLAATLGLLLYELHNSELYEYATRRAQTIEHELELPSLHRSGPGGPFSDQPGPALRIFGLVPVGGRQALGLVYTAALAGWTYLVAWGALHALHVAAARKLGGFIGIAVGLLLLAELSRTHPRPDQQQPTLEQTTLSQDS